jgi:hypothetical protein
VLLEISFSSASRAVAYNARRTIDQIPSGTMHFSEINMLYSYICIPVVPIKASAAWFLLFFSPTFIYDSFYAVSDLYMYLTKTKNGNDQ